MKKKIFALLCALTCLVAFIPCERVSASDSKYNFNDVVAWFESKGVTMPNMTLLEPYIGWDFVVLDCNCAGNTGYEIVLFEEDVQPIFGYYNGSGTSCNTAKGFDFLGYVDGPGSAKNVVRFYTYNSGQTWFFAEYDGSPWMGEDSSHHFKYSNNSWYYSDNSSVAYEYIAFSSRDVQTASVDGSYVDLSTIYKFPYIVRTANALKFGLQGESFDASLGYIDNLVFKTLAITDKFGTQTGEYYKKVSFDKYSTTGIDLTDGDYRIRMYESVCYYKGYTKNVYDDFFPMVQVGEFSIDDCSIMYNIQDAFAICSSETDTSRITWWDIVWNTLIRSDIDYYQIVKYNDDGSCTYGGYIKVESPADDSGYMVSTTLDGISFDSGNGGYVDNDVSSGVGSGTNIDDAELDADEDLSGNPDGVIEDIYNVENLVESVESLASMVGNFPQVIGSVLSFLPAWLQMLIYSAFGVGAILFVWKIIT